jgi:hypothetical protein
VPAGTRGASPPPPGLFRLAACVFKASNACKKFYANCTRQETHAIVVFAFVPPFQPPCPHRQAPRAVRLIADRKVSKIQQTEL